MGIFDFFRKSKTINLKKNNLKNLQKIICGNVNITYSEKELLEISSKFINERIELIDSCLKLINNTNSINIYFKYYSIIIEKLNELCLLEPYYQFNSPTPSEQLKNILLEKDLRSKDMLFRAWNNNKLKLLDLKTKKSKENNINTFFELAYSHIYELGNESTIFLAQIKKESEEILSDVKNKTDFEVDFNFEKENSLLLKLNKCTNASDRHFA